MRYGPLQVWQNYYHDSLFNVTPPRRLRRAGKYGLIVSNHSRLSGGITIKSALRLERIGVGICERNDEGVIIRIYATQLMFDF